MKRMELIECVPNFSEGRRPDVIKAIQAEAEDAGVHVLDLHSDSVHNRSVLTFAGSAPAVIEAAFRCVARAAELIDMRQHQGEHPRLGATDVVPFIPMGEATMARCIELARQLGARIGLELGLPVYLYAEAAARPERRWLPFIRRGEYEALVTEIGVKPERAPDFGPSQIGSAGATAVGARPFLVAYNVHLLTPQLAVAEAIARRIRQSSGGFPSVQARAMRTADPGVVQVSMNLLNLEVTPGHVVLEAINRLAGEQGVIVLGAELVGLMPMTLATSAAAAPLGLSGLKPSDALEYRLLARFLEQDQR
ncbi:MAG: glutamate formimidoyltransferase [Chloroflexota bacterium]